MANLNIGAALTTVNTLASLPVTVRTVYATISAASNLSLAAAMYQGQELELVINPTAKITLPMPTATGWYTTFGDTLPLIKNTKTILTITCIGANTYLIDCKTTLNSINGYGYVDLGLPSGLLWATCNVGASQPHEYGKYFQWGATEGYYSGTTEAANHSSWGTCPWPVSTNISLIPIPLDAAHDAARANMGGEWRMPTKADGLELTTYTTTALTTVSGVNGVRFTSKSNSSNSIFIPKAGDYISGTYYSSNELGSLWTSNILESNTNSAYMISLYSRGAVAGDQYMSRHYGYSVRGVLG